MSNNGPTMGGSGRVGGGGGSGDITAVNAGNGILVATPGGPTPTVSADYGANIQDVGAANLPGTDLQLAREDHVHEGVHHLTAGFGISVDATLPAAPVINSLAAATPSTLETLLARSRLVIGAGDFAFDMDDLTTALLASNWTVGGTPVVDLTHGPGVWAFPNVVNTFLVKPPATVVNPAVTPWHFAVRVRFPTALSAGEIFSFGLIKDGALTDACIAGTRQASSATKFVFTNIKASASTHVLSTINIDTTNFHKLEMWFDGTNVYGSVDGETPVVVVAAAGAPVVYLTPTNWLRATANVGGNAGLIDYIYSAAARTAT